MRRKVKYIQPECLKRYDKVGLAIMEKEGDL